MNDLGSSVLSANSFKLMTVFNQLLILTGCVFSIRRMRMLLLPTELLTQLSAAFNANIFFI